MSVRRTAVGALLSSLAVAGLACTVTGPRTSRPLRVTATETGGDVEFTVEVPVEQVTCVERDYRRSPGDPATARVVWAARCTAGNDCLPSVHYGDQRLQTIKPAAPLGPSAPGTCYECTIEGRGGRGLVSFQMTPRGSFDRCSRRVGDL